MSAVDLQPFCSTDPVRGHIVEPFSHGEWSYATDGHIMVRVLRRADVPERKAAPGDEAERIFANLGERLFLSTTLKIAKPRLVRCWLCEGYGLDCPECNGTGCIPTRRSTELLGAIFDARYVRMIANLPDLHLPATAPALGPLAFRFDSGEGALMSMRRHAEQRLVCRVKQIASLPVTPIAGEPVRNPRAS